VVLRCLIALERVVIHLVREVSIKARMSSQNVDDVLSLLG
jgi:hypothetical protein